MESLTCLAFNHAHSNLLIMGFHCNRVVAYLLVMMSASPSWCLLSCIPSKMMVSLESSLCFPVPVHLASAIPMMARL